MIFPRDKDNDNISYGTDKFELVNDFTYPYALGNIEHYITQEMKRFYFLFAVLVRKLFQNQF